MVSWPLAAVSVLADVFFTGAGFALRVAVFRVVFAALAVAAESTGSFSAARLTPASVSSRRIDLPSVGLMPASAKARRSSASERWP